jgi:hypothetical protein
MTCADPMTWLPSVGQGNGAKSQLAKPMAAKGANPAVTAARESVTPSSTDNVGTTPLPKVSP